MLMNLQQLDLCNENTVSSAILAKRMVLLSANTALLPGLLIIPTTNGVVLIA
jgi:hypothetical protein